MHVRSKTTQPRRKAKTLAILPNILSRIDCIFTDNIIHFNIFGAPNCREGNSKNPWQCLTMGY
jgi:hypothetical protein